VIYVTGFFAFLKALPQLLELLEKLGKAVELGQHQITVTIDLKKFDAATDQANQTGDTSGLENQFRPHPRSE
jgi:lipid A disaccharide synthetase